MVKTKEFASILVVNFFVADKNYDSAAENIPNVSDATFHNLLGLSFCKFISIIIFKFSLFTCTRQYTNIVDGIYIVLIFLLVQSTLLSKFLKWTVMVIEKITKIWKKLFAITVNTVAEKHHQGSFDVKIFSYKFFHYIISG